MEIARKMVTNLTNKLFTHFLITIGNVSLHFINFVNTAYEIINTNSFIYIASKKYLSDEFYMIMIDIDTCKHSRTGYRQFIAYTRDIKYTTIHFSKVDTIYIQFSISSISFMAFILI